MASLSLQKSASIALPISAFFGLVDNYLARILESAKNSGVSYELKLTERELLPALFLHKL